MLPSALYLRHTDGDPIGPLALSSVEVLFDTHVVDANTPVSFDGDRFAALKTWPELLKKLEAAKAKLDRGQAPSGIRGKPVGGAAEAPAAPQVDAASMTDDLSPRSATESIDARLPTGVGQILRLGHAKATGLLTVSGDAGQIVIAFKDGHVAKVDTTVAALDLGAYLLSDGVVDADGLEEAKANAPNMGGDIGGALIAMGKVQPHAYFEKFVAWAKKVLGAATTPDYPEVAFEDTEVPAPPFPLGFDRLGAAVEASRAGLSRTRLSELLMPKRPCPLIVSQIEGLSIDDVKLKPKELRVLRRVNGVRTLGDIIDELGGSEEKSLPILQAVHFAEQAGFIVYGEDPLAKKELAEAAQVRAKLAQLENQTYFEILEVTETSSDEDVRTKYAELAKLYHPDKVRAQAAPELLDARRKIFALISEAADALETEDQRYKYAHDIEQGLVANKDDMQKVQDTLHAETLFKKAEILVKVKKYEEARAHIDEAIDLNGGDTEFMVLRAYIGYLTESKRGDGAAAAKVATKEILELMKNDANIASGYLYLGHLQKALDKDELALKYFEKVLEYDEHHPEALSQVRVGRMRRDKKKKKKRWGL